MNYYVHNMVKMNYNYLPWAIWHAFEVTAEVIRSIVCEASSFGSYPKATIIYELPALDKSLSGIFLNHSLLSSTP